jgi:hypothetical protein
VGREVVGGWLRVCSPARMFCMSSDTSAETLDCLMGDMANELRVLSIP